MNAGFVRALAACVLLAPTAHPASAQAPEAPDAAINAPDLASPPGFALPDATLPYLDLEGAWPERLGTPDAGVVIAWGGAEQPEFLWAGSRVGPLAPRPDDEDQRALEPILQGRVLRAEQSGSFLIRLRPRLVDGKPVSARQASRSFCRFVSARAGDERDALLQRTWFALLEPADGREARGVALLMPGVFGTPEGILASFTNALRARGWLVVRMLAQPSRFTERVVFPIDAREPLDRPARRIAEELGDRAAECAYAVQGVLAHLERQRPSLAGLPRIAIGFSGGAITLPTVVAREPSRYRAAVLVGGGAHYWLINQESNYAGMIDAVTASWEPPDPGAGPRDELARAYLARAPLDAFHTARHLPMGRTLIFQADRDLGVPSALGDVLWERASRCERWVRPGGHESLFMIFRKEIPAVLDWIDAREERAP